MAEKVAEAARAPRSGAGGDGEERGCGGGEVVTTGDTGYNRPPRLQL